MEGTREGKGSGTEAERKRNGRGKEEEKKRKGRRKEAKDGAALSDGHTVTSLTESTKQSTNSERERERVTVMTKTR